MTKKFSIKKLVAGVLAAAMVVTALPVSGLTVKAASDETDKLVVNRAYNPNSGEHFFTADLSEYNSLVALGWKGEGKAWTAPYTSKTPIYRVYNPNSGEHVFTTGDAEVKALVAAGWKDEGIGMYSDDNKGVGIYRAYNPNATGQFEAGAHHFTANVEEFNGLVAAGWGADNNGQPIFYGVADQSATITLVDKNGLQKDGTALRTDSLTIIFGSDLGTPKTVAWYKNGAVVKINSSGTLDDSDFSMTPANDGSVVPGTTQKKLDAGEYYVVIANTEGKSYTSNSIVIADEDQAVITAFGIADNYEALQKFADDPATNKEYIDYIPATSTETSTAVATVKLNKDYKGDFYMIEKDDEKFTDIDAAYKFTPSSTNTKTVEKKSQFTDETLATEALGGTVKAIKYVDSDSSVEYKILSGFGVGAKKVTRGESYKVVFDQDGSVKTGSTIKDWTVSDAVAVPYLYKPDKLEVTDPQTTTNGAAGQGWTLTASFNGTKAAWLNATGDELASKVDAVLYVNGTSSNEDGTEFSSNLNGTAFGVSKRLDADGATPGAQWPTTALLGVTDDYLVKAWAGNAASLATHNDAKNYVYGKMTIAKGICDKEAVELTSDPIAVPDEVVLNAKIDYDSDKPTDATISLEKLRGDATVYLAYDQSDFSETDTSKYRKSVEVKAKATSVTMSDVFSQKDITDGKVFDLVVVPKDGSSYATKKVDANKTIDSVAKSYKLTGTTTNITNITGAAVTLTNQLVVKNQFGNTMAPGAITAKEMDFEKNTGASTIGGTKATLTVTAADPSTVTIDTTTGITAPEGFCAGDKMTFKIDDGAVIKLVCTAGGDGGSHTAANDGHSVWKVVIEDK